MLRFVRNDGYKQPVSRPLRKSVLMSTIDLAASPSDLRALAEQSNAWPFEQAKAIVARLKKKPKDEVLFETGYGPSGLPHIGTFGEVARTTMVRHAFRVLTEDKIKTRLLAFSDDMDGLRKVPDNVPNKEMLERAYRQAAVADPRSVLQRVSVVRRAQQCAAARLSRHLWVRLRVRQLHRLLHLRQVRHGIAAHVGTVRCGHGGHAAEPARGARGDLFAVPPDLSAHRAGAVCADLEHDVKAGTVSYDDPETKERVTVPVTGGHCKLQWKPDWAMRWYALGVDYEMAGKDLIDSVKLSGKICAALGGLPPEGFNYELFLDDKGQKISKSKGNGLTIDEWLRYASPESLSLFMYREPKAAKRLYFDVIPRNVDDYQQFLDGFSRQDGKQQLPNPVWHIHAGHPPASDMPVTFQLLLTLVSSSNAENAATLWGFIGRYRPGVTPQTHPKLDAMVGYAINYYRDFVAPTKKFREPTESERVALQDLRDALSNMPAGFDRRRHPERGLRDRPPRAVPRPGEKGQGRPARRLARLVQHALPGAARPGKRPALRLVRRGLWPCQCGGDDRRRAGEERVAPSFSRSPDGAQRDPGFSRVMQNSRIALRSVRARSAPAVMRGLDPRIHLASRNFSSLLDRRVQPGSDNTLQCRA